MADRHFKAAMNNFSRLSSKKASMQLNVVLVGASWPCTGAAVGGLGLRFPLIKFPFAVAAFAMVCKSAVCSSVHICLDCRTSMRASCSVVGVVKPN